MPRNCTGAPDWSTMRLPCTRSWPYFSTTLFSAVCACATGARAAITTTISVATSFMSVRERDRIVAVHGVTERLVKLDLVERPHLGEQHRGDVVLRVHPEQRAGRTIPEELADGARRLRRILRRRDAHREVDAEAHLPLAGQPGLVGDFLRHRVGRHELHGLGLQDARAAEFAAA